MMGCLDDNQILAFVAGKLSRVDASRVQQHLDTCTGCRELLAEVARTSTGPRPARTFRTGDLLAGKYRLEHAVGEGASGVVWQALDTVTRRRVALKLLASSERDAIRRFFREARVTAALQHPHIVDVSDVFVVPDTGSPAMVMELLVGTSFGRWLRLPGRPVLEVHEAARILVPVVAAVAAAASVGVVHRDLKPENIFLVGQDPDAALGDPRVKVLDFGLAKLTASDGVAASTGRLTRTGLVVGTPHYMAPEQATAGGSVGGAADVWALGVMLYEALAGVRPVEGTSLSHLFRALASPAIVPLARRRPSLPPSVTALVSRMLTTDAGQRPSLDEVRGVLVAVADR